MTTTEKLSFTTTSLQNVIISNESDSIYYDVKTWEEDPGLTKVQKLNAKTQLYDLVAELENANGRPVAVRFQGGNETVRVEEWLKMENIERNRWGTWDGKVSFTGSNGEVYAWSVKDGVLHVSAVIFWKSGGLKEICIKLMREGTTSEKPLAVFRPYQRWMYVLSITEAPSIDVVPEALEILDALIVSFLVTEGTRRGYFY
ncbi:hypothetical protein GLOTRDRAFT_133711 [Gloeophyllum trabeum ATCC 11539]|uniref:DUF6593 domain-containing protein n=1 Tax=Gloeophyllum trabeum (strain ATCC 11539 / FP-39264 / Madison 617) TaxID=670483 RepID=S7PTG2_GLOTA|nr:uncharacterized protein GLOTRDRAFT_133711 [Gloeophyllum trabeum ATCC 11539]EPQ50597.1 hypothetical protein GLOTRDRAFT_133711 [Gloeophyllum trabeum ATCC 11539]